MKQIYSEGLDYYCPHCHREMYVLGVSDILKSGGKCMWCNEPLRNGESINWHTADGKIVNSNDMDTQHISNVMYFLEQRNRVSDKTYKTFADELKYRGIEQLPYKPYYPEELELRIYRTT